MSDERLNRLAEAAGLSIEWVDADGRNQRVAPDVLRAVLAGLGLNAATEQDVDDSLAKLHLNNGGSSLPPMLTVDAGQPLELGRWFQPGNHCQIRMEDGHQWEATLDEQARLPRIEQPGYHHLRLADHEFCVAVSPSACPSVRELAGAAAWGLTAQLYSLRRPGDGGLGAVSYTHLTLPTKRIV